MILLFFLWIVICKTQLLILDSRMNQKNQPNLDLFHQQFSIWFMCYYFTNEESKDLLKITNQKYVIMKLSTSQQSLRITYNKNQVFQIQNKQIQKNQWIHLILNQNDNFLKSEFKLKTNYNSMIEYQFYVNSSEIINNQTLISLLEDYFSFCLVYDRELYEIEPIIRSINMLQLITQQQITFLSHYQNSNFEVFMRRYKDIYNESSMISIYQEPHPSALLLSVLEVDNQFQIFESKLLSFYDSNPRLFSWFRIFISFNHSELQCEIQFIDEKIIKSFEIKPPKMFYTIQVNNKESNYQFLKITTYFKVKNYELFDEKQLQIFDGCNRNIRYYFDLESNSCKDYLDDYQIKNIENYQYYDLQLVFNNQRDQERKQIISQVIANYVLSNLTNQEVYPYFKLENQEYNFNKEPFLLWKNYEYKFCYQNYFGQFCQKFIKRCQSAKDIYCKKCFEGYLPIGNKCVRCPQNCLLCILEQNKRYKCLIPKIKHFVNRKYLAILCKFKYCNTNGSEVTQDQTIIQIKQCFDDLKCPLKQCSKIYNYCSLYYNDCLFLPLAQQLQIYQYLYYQDRQNQHRLEDLEFILIQNYPLYGSTLFNNIVSNYYLLVQMQTHIQKLYLHKFDFSFIEYNYQNKFNLECIEKNFDQNWFLKCEKYKIIQNNKCKKVPCFYRLEITDILYYIGEQVYIKYNNFQYKSILQVLESVINIGIEFHELYLQIIFIYQYFDDANVQEVILNFNDRSTIPYFENSIIEIDLKFQQNYEFSQKSLNISIKADKIIIKNQQINLILFLTLNADQIELINIIFAYKAFFNFGSGTLFIMKFLTVQDDFKIGIEKFTEVVIQNFTSNQFCLRLQFQNIGKFELQNFHYFRFQPCYQNIFTFYQIQSITLNRVSFEFGSTDQQDCFQGKEVQTITIQNLVFSSNSLILSKPFIFEEVHLINIQNYSCFIDYVTNSTILKIQNVYKLQIIEFEFVTKLFDQSMLLYINSNTMELTKFKFSSQVFQPHPLISIFSAILQIEDFKIFQQNDTYIQLNFQEKRSLIFISGLSAEIINLHFDGIKLCNCGLLQIYSKWKSNFQKLSIINSYFQMSSNTGVIILRDRYSLIKDLLLSSIQIDNKPFVEFYIFEIHNDVKFHLENSTIKQIRSNTTLTGFIFSFDSIYGNIIRIDITECKNIGLMQIESERIYIAQVNYFKNYNQQIMVLVLARSRSLDIYNSTMILEETRLVLLAIPANNNIISFIRFQNIQFYLYEVVQQFEIETELSYIFFINISISYFPAQQKLIQTAQAFIFIFYGNLYVTDFVAKNLRQALFFIYKSQKVDMQNVLIENAEMQFQKCVFFVLQSYFVLKNIRLISITNLDQIFWLSQAKELIDFSNLFLKDIKNVTNIFQIGSNNSDKIMYLKDITISNSLDGYIFSFFSQKQFNIHVENLFIHNANTFFIQERGQYNFKLKQSIIRIRNFNFDDSRLQAQLINSEIICDKYFKLHHTQFDGSYIYNVEKQEIVKDLKFIMTISLNRVNYLKAIQLEHRDEKVKKKFLVTQNGSLHHYFYIPSGQKISSYKQLNFQSLNLEQVYRGFYLVLLGFLNGYSQYTFKCSQQQFYNDQLVNQSELYEQIQQGLNDINENVFIINPLNINYTVFIITCSNYIDDYIVQLQYNVKAFPCQLGEFSFKNQCIECNTSLNQYSVHYNSIKCNQIDFNQIKSVKKGLLQLNQRFWRYNYTSDIIEYCNSNYCEGGWVPGDRSCSKSRIGALCQECDLYNIRGDGYYTNSNQQCFECEGFSIQLIFKLLLALMWQLLIIFNGYYSNQKLSQQYLMFRIGFRQFYQILYRQSIDIAGIIIKMFINYIFMLYIVKQNLNIVGYTFVNNINVINNPGLITKAQIDCILSKVFQMEIIYSSFFYQIILVFFIIQLAYTIYLIIMKIKKMRFQLGLILSTTEGILIYNVNIILVISFNLLSYKLASGLKWIKYNMQYLYNSDNHMSMMKFIIPITAIFLVIPLLFPFMIKQLSTFNRQVKRIYAIYHQEFKPQLIFWEYLILYTKYSIIILQNFCGQQSQLGVILMGGLSFLIFNLKPYYLQNLNVFETNMYILYGVQLSVLLMNTFKDEIIITLNLLIFNYYFQKIYTAYCIRNQANIIKFKLSLISKFNWIKRFSGIERNKRQLTNKLLLIQLIRIQILKKSNMGLYVKQATLQTENEIEMPIIFKQVPALRQQVQH